MTCLYDSSICRLCAEDNVNGELLYAANGNDNGNINSEVVEETDLSSLVNRYLPLKVRDDGKLPRTICPGCNIQLEATVQFFDLLTEGQKKIRDLYKAQVELLRKAERERLRNERKAADNSANENLNLSTDQMDEDKIDGIDIEKQIIINILPDGSMYTAEHEMSLQMSGLDKPKRKRGRPPKIQTDEAKDDSIEETAQNAVTQIQEEQKQDEDVVEIDGDGRRRRRRKTPKRYMEAVQGKELERIFKEEGVIDEDDAADDDDVNEHLDIPSNDANEEVIGHLETEEGKDLGQLVIINRGKNRGRPKLRRRKNKFTCQVCGRGFLQRSRYIIHKSFHRGTKYECLGCKREFPSKDQFQAHQKNAGHTGGGLLETNVPVEALENSPESSQTRNEDPPDVPQKDSTPDEVTIDEDGSRNLVKTETEAKVDPLAHLEGDVQCEKCQKQFQSTISYNQHLKTDHEVATPEESPSKTNQKPNSEKKAEKGFSCDICGKVLNHPSSVLYHKEAEHNNGRRFVCNKCGKSFKHKQLLQRHQLVHSEERPYVCKSCNSSFKTKANLINHQFTHTGEKKYFCEICSQQFAHKTSLTLHYRWHKGHKPYTCEVCNKSFSQNGNLQEHMRIHTGEKPYCCDHCGRKFTTSSQFKLHVKRHTGERPWKCEYCSKTFLHKDTWKCHVRRHKGERPFQCAHCNRGFTEQWALKKHLRLHTGEKPYVCDICSKAFADCSNLAKHKKVHRENKVTIDEVPEGPPIEEVWQILPESQAEGNSLAQVITGDDLSNDGIQQIIYVSYQDPDDPNQSRTLHFVEPNIIQEKGEAMEAARRALPTLNVEETQMIAVETTREGHGNAEERVHMDLSDSDLHLQITDEEGNQIPLTIQDARQLLSEGQFVSQLNDGQTIRVHSGALPQALTTSLDVGTVNIVESMNDIDNKSKITISSVQDDTDAIVKVLEDNSAGNANVDDMSQLNHDESEQTIEFTTSDGQKVRLVTSYAVDPLELTSEYLTIV